MVIFHVHRYEELIAQIFTLLKLLYIFSTMTVKILILLFKKYSPILKFHMEPTTKETHQSKTIMRGKKKPPQSWGITLPFKLYCKAMKS